MKCEKCGNREATCHYHSNINGEQTENHFCSECAKEEGLERMFRSSMVMSGLWGSPYGMLTGLFGAPFESHLSRLMGHAPVRAAAMPPWYGFLIGGDELSTNVRDKRADNIPEDAGEDVRCKRELSVLKSQLKQMIEAQEFEKAAELRDKIREMEK